MDKDSFTSMHYPFQRNPSRYSDQHYLAYSYNNNQCPTSLNHLNNQLVVIAENQATTNPQPVVCQGNDQMNFIHLSTTNEDHFLYPGGPCNPGLVRLDNICIGVGSSISNWDAGSTACSRFKGASNLPSAWYCESKKRDQLKVG